MHENAIFYAVRGGGAYAGYALCWIRHWIIVGSRVDRFPDQLKKCKALTFGSLYKNNVLQKQCPSKDHRVKADRSALQRLVIAIEAGRKVNNLPEILRPDIKFTGVKSANIPPSRLYPGRLAAAPRIYPSLPGSTTLYCAFVKCLRLPDYTPPSQNLPPLFNKFICATFPESIPPSQDTPPFSTTICDPPRIYPSLPEYTPVFNNYNIMRNSQNLPSLP